MNHAERYEYLVDKISSMRRRSSDLDASYHAALFLMASHPALFEKIGRYLDQDGIDFTSLMQKEEFDYDWMKVTTDAAHNLFSWDSECEATPFEISRMPAPAIRALFTALLIANGDYQVSVQENSEGEKVFVLDDSVGRQREALQIQIEHMLETRHEDAGPPRSPEPAQAKRDTVSPQHRSGRPGCYLRGPR